VTDTDKQQVRLVRTIPGDRDEVFRAWTDPELLKEWFGPGEFTIPTAELDVRPGGDYLIVMKAAEGDGMKLTGSFREIEPPDRLVFTWSWRLVWDQAPESLVTVEFREVDGGTEVTIVHGDFDSSDEGAPYRLGWEGGLDKLEKLDLASRRA
jgi:uncharacterized protein YndB with AHSA1/START domain